MIARRPRWRVGAYATVDVLAVLAAFWAAWFLRFEAAIIPLFKNPPEELTRYFQLMPVVALLWPVVFYFHGLYQVKPGKSRVDEALTILVAVVLATLILSGLQFWWRPEGPLRPDGSHDYFTFSRIFLFLFALLTIPAVIVGRLLFARLTHHRLDSGPARERVLIAGAGELGREVARKIALHRELGCDVVGFVDDEPSLAGKSVEGVPVLGPLRQVGELLREQPVEQLFVALPLDAHRKMMRLLREVGQECVQIKLVPDILQYATLKAALEDLDGTPVINLSEVPLQGWSTLVKRAMDILVAGLLLLALLPFLPVLALIIWLDDRGPIFYRQERMGLDGKPFQILKLRSMRVNAEASTGPVWAVKDDPRRTRLGSFLRKWSIDELPQLWNVLMGDMSLIGPRPERPAFVHEFRHKIPQYMLRHRVKAGITGWAQVHGWRGNTSIKKRLEYDLYYIENWSVGLDLKILWMTAVTFAFDLRQNAY
jgi:Undecaprenyl-phosphate glucose phosphotransferase